jgi:hypothetical protein
VTLTLLILLTSAYAGSPEQDIEALLERPDVAGARALCLKKNVQAEGDQATRNLCAEAFLEQTEEMDSLLEWRTFRTHWKGTKWANHGLNREAELALMALGYNAEEDAYRKIAKRYTETPTGALAMERAAQTAINDIQKQQKQDRYVRVVAKRYPHRAPELVSEYFDAFKKEPLIGEITTDVSQAPLNIAQWVVRHNGSIDLWENVASAHVASHKLPEGVGSANLTDGPLPRCSGDQWTHGIKIRTSDGDWFVPMKTQACLKSPLALSWDPDGQLSSFQTPSGAVVEHTSLPAGANRNTVFLTKRGIAFQLPGDEWLLTTFSGHSGALPSAPTTLMTLSPEIGVGSGDGVRTFSPVVLAHLGVPTP